MACMCLEVDSQSRNRKWATVKLRSLTSSVPSERAGPAKLSELCEQAALPRGPAVRSAARSRAAARPEGWSRL